MLKTNFRIKAQTAMFKHSPLGGVPGAYPYGNIIKKNIVKCIHNPVGVDIICLQKIINDNMQLSVMNLQMYFKKCMSIVKRIHNLVGADVICPLCIIYGAEDIF